MCIVPALHIHTDQMWFFNKISYYDVIIRHEGYPSSQYYVRIIYVYVYLDIESVILMWTVVMLSQNSGS